MRLELTRRSDYAIRAMLALTRADADLLSAPRIAAHMNIPVRFLPQIMADLVAAGLVSAQPGRAGGYRLARPVVEVSILDIVTATEGDTRRRTCVLRDVPCATGRVCDVHEVFARAQDALLEQLGAARLGDLALARRPG